MKHPAARELFAYWNELRGERTAPERCDIDPTAIRNVLADTFMLDIDMAQGFPFRLAGTRVNGLFDAEQKGQSFLALWRPEERHNIAAVLQTVADGACPVVAGAVAAPKGQEDGTFELLFLPLRHYGKTHSRILGLIRIVEEPAWFGLAAVGPLALRSLRIVDTAHHEDVRKDTRERVAVGQDAIVAPSTVEPAQTTRPYLRVIQGGL